MFRSSAPVHIAPAAAEEAAAEDVEDPLPSPSRRGKPNLAINTTASPVLRALRIDSCSSMIGDIAGAENPDAEKAREVQQILEILGGAVEWDVVATIYEDCGRDRGKAVEALLQMLARHDAAERRVQRFRSETGELGDGTVDSPTAALIEELKPKGLVHHGSGGSGAPAPLDSPSRRLIEQLREQDEAEAALRARPSSRNGFSFGTPERHAAAAAAAVTGRPSSRDGYFLPSPLALPPAAAGEDGGGGGGGGDDELAAQIAAAEQASLRTGAIENHKRRRAKEAAQAPPGSPVRPKAFRKDDPAAMSPQMQPSAGRVVVWANGASGDSGGSGSAVSAPRDRLDSYMSGDYSDDDSEGEGKHAAPGAAQKSRGQMPGIDILTGGRGRTWKPGERERYLDYQEQAAQGRKARERAAARGEEQLVLSPRSQRRARAEEERAHKERMRTITAELDATRRRQGLEPASPHSLLGQPRWLRWVDKKTRKMTKKKPVRYSNGTSECCVQ